MSHIPLKPGEHASFIYKEKNQKKRRKGQRMSVFDMDESIEQAVEESSRRANDAQRVAHTSQLDGVAEKTQAAPATADAETTPQHNPYEHGARLGNAQHAQPVEVFEDSDIQSTQALERPECSSPRILKLDTDARQEETETNEQLANSLLNCSDFPSLSGGAGQTQQSNLSQAVWGGSSLRGAGSNAPIHRPPRGNPQTPGQPSVQSLAESENTRPSFNRLNPGLDELRFADRGEPIPEPRRTGQADDFPPLGGLGRADPRQSGGQASQLAGLGTGSAYIPGQASRNGGFPPDSQTDGIIGSMGTGGRMTSPLDGPSGGELI